MGALKFGAKSSSTLWLNNERLNMIIFVVAGAKFIYPNFKKDDISNVCLAKIANTP